MSSIGSRAFSGCTALQGPIVLPASVTALASDVLLGVQPAPTLCGGAGSDADADAADNDTTDDDAADDDAGDDDAAPEAAGARLVDALGLVPARDDDGDDAAAIALVRAQEPGI